MLVFPPQVKEVKLTSPVMTNRGTAFITFTETPDAQAAISHMHEAQLDGAIINVSIVLPAANSLAPHRLPDEELHHTIALKHDGRLQEATEGTASSELWASWWSTSFPISIAPTTKKRVAA